MFFWFSWHNFNFFDIQSPLAKKSMIVSVALGIQEYITYIPRVTSFLKPTANMFSAYLAIISLFVLNFIFNSNYYKKNKWINFLVLVLVSSLSLLTMSRGLPPLLLSIAFGIHILQWNVPFRLLLLISFYSSAIITFIFLQLFTIFYMINSDFSYSNDPSYKKEITDLGTKKIPNPVYFMRDEVGKERVEFKIDYSVNHYAWLKYAGFQSISEKPYVGHGVGMFNNVLDNLIKNKKIDLGLKDFKSAQSQYFTLLAEIGIFGFLIILYITVMSLSRIRNLIIKENKNESLLKSIYLSAPIISILIIDMDILSFRWFWGFLAVGFITYKFAKDDKYLL